MVRPNVSIYTKAVITNNDGLFTVIMSNSRMEENKCYIWVNDEHKHLIDAWYGDACDGKRVFESYIEKLA